MCLAVEAYRLLPMIVRARIENWKIDARDLVLGQRISRNKVVSPKQLSATYRATYKWTDVACKVIECDLLIDTNDLRRMQTELTVLAQLRHPNVVGFLGASIESHSCMLVTELLTGGSLEDVLACDPAAKVGRSPSGRQAMRWALDLARAVTYMHQSDPPVVHRDIRPACLLLSSAGSLKVTGFGSAQILAASRQASLDRDGGPANGAGRNVPPAKMGRAPSPKAASRSTAGGGRS